MQLVAQIVKAGADAFGRIGLYLSLFQNEKQLTRCAADVLVSNAGICPFADFLTMPHSTWERTRQVNLDGSFYIVQGKISTRYFCGCIVISWVAVANQMKSQTPQGGSIIGISSISALVGGGMQWYVKASIKSFLHI